MGPLFNNPGSTLGCIFLSLLQVGLHLLLCKPLITYIHLREQSKTGSEKIKIVKSFIPVRPVLPKFFFMGGGGGVGGYFFTHSRSRLEPL